MRTVPALFLGVAAGIVLALPAGADESAVRLVEDEGRAQVIGACSICHSVDYIEMNSPFLDRDRWQATVNKMIKVMGAPVRDEDVPVILDYLSRNYSPK